MPKAKRPSKKPPTRKQIAQRKHRRHVFFYVLLAAAIVAVRVFYPDVVDSAVGEVHTLFQDIKLLAKDGTTSILALVGLAYALRELWKAFRKS